jgi:hypothetical protein
MMHRLANPKCLIIVCLSFGCFWNCKDTLCYWVEFFLKENVGTRELLYQVFCIHSSQAGWCLPRRKSKLLFQNCCGAGWFLPSIVRNHHILFRLFLTVPLLNNSLLFWCCLTYMPFCFTIYSLGSSFQLLSNDHTRSIVTLLENTVELQVRTLWNKSLLMTILSFFISLFISWGLPGYDVRI